MDGVLVDTDASYIEAVLRTVQWLLVHDAGIADDGPAVSRADVRAFKLAGGWNNDWDLSAALYRWLVAGPTPGPSGASPFGTPTAPWGGAVPASNPRGASWSGAPATLRGGAAPAETTMSLRREAGSAPDAARISLEEHGRRAGARAPRTWEEIRGIFDEIYGGTATAVARYGMPPRVHNPRGLCENEAVLLTPALVAELRSLGVAKFGVVTGRSQAEWEAIAARVPLPPGTVVSTEAHGKKPDPAPLRRVVEALDACSFLAVGDTMDDLRMVQEYARLPGARPGLPVVLCPPEEEATYGAAGAVWFIRELDGLPGVLRSLLRT